MKRILIALAIIVLFVIVNRAAFEGYFSDDDLDNLSWATVAGLDAFTKDLINPVFSLTNSRPTGGLFYRFMGNAFGLQFQPYIIPLFTLHLLNAFILYLILRRKSIDEFPALAAILFFLFHAALLHAWWKPMYIFDLLAATFCLLAWLLFPTRYWLAALPCFWLAYKSKEVALFFPIVLALENWRRALPFLAISLNFGIQATLVNRNRPITPYTLRFELPSLLTTIPYYFTQAIVIKFGALLLAPLAYFLRYREFLISLAGTAALMIPLFFLPGRLFAVYLYVPFLALIPGLAFAFSRIPRYCLTLALLGFLFIDFNAMRHKRSIELAIAQEARPYVEQLAAEHKRKPLPSIAFYENAPLGYVLHGMTGALRLITSNPDARVLDPSIEANRKLAMTTPLPTLSWQAPTKRLHVNYHQYGEAVSSSLDFSSRTAAWQLVSGWYEYEGAYRWAARSAKLRLLAAPEHKALTIRYNNGPAFIAAVKQLSVDVYANNELLGTTRFTTPGTPTITYQLKRTLTSPIDIEVRSSPGYAAPGDNRTLGIAVFSVSLIR